MGTLEDPAREFPAGNWFNPESIENESFLYSLDYLPALLLLGAAAVLGRWRRAARVCAALTLLGASLDNVAQFRRAAAFVEEETAAVHAPLPEAATGAPLGVHHA